MIALLLLILGLVLGSFLNVCIWRIPRGESVVTPPSHCPKCGRRIRGYDNIPVLSYIILGGRCRDCGRRISLRYPVVEALVGLLFVASYLRFGLDWTLLRALVFVCLLVVMAFIDLDHQIIPFQISVPGVILGLGGSFLPGSEITIAEALLGAGMGAAFVFFAIALWRYVLAGVFRRFGIDQKEGMGFGDLPLAAMIGAFVGWRSLLVALFCAVLSGIVAGLVQRARGKATKGQPMPFGPFLALGGVVGLFFGSDLFSLYISAVLGR